jgi:hypothetical protein
MAAATGLVVNEAEADLLLEIAVFIGYFKVTMNAV